MVSVCLSAVSEGLGFTSSLGKYFSETNKQTGKQIKREKEQVSTMDARDKLNRPVQSQADRVPPQGTSKPQVAAGHGAAFV